MHGIPVLFLEKARLMEKFGLSENVLRYLTNLPALHPHIQKIAIYGSRAKGNFHVGSDIDLAIWGPELTWDELARIEAYLHGLPTLYKYDVTHYDMLNHEGLKSHIDTVGKIIYSAEGKEPQTS